MKTIPTPSQLFPEQVDRERIEKILGRQINQALSNVSNGDVLPRIDMEAFREQLNGMDFNAPQDLEAVMAWTIDSLQSGVVQMTHPGYLGLFNPSPTFPAECADRISGAFNPQICVWSHAPIAVDIENHVIEQVAKRIGLPEGSGGHFTSGGSEANATAFICALTASEPQFAEQGARAFKGQARIYVSAESHLAWLKIAHQSGIGRIAIRLVNTDGMGRMDPDALHEIILADIDADDHPVMIAATAGTTNAGMVDPLPACADIAQEHELWFHVDAAWGGGLIATKRHASILDGIERADSVTIDAHKWFATTMGTGMYLTKRTDVLADTFHVTASYMPSNDQTSDLYVNSMQWSRRFMGLRLFLSLATAGWEGYAAHMEHSIGLIDYFCTEMKTHGWRVANQSAMAVACLIPPDHSGAPEEVVDRVVAFGKEWISVAKYEGRSVVRVCVANGRTSKLEIDQLIQRLIES